MSKIIAVHGATGLQGGSVVHALLKSDWKVRALTRTPSSSVAKALVAAGAEVVTANLDDEASLIKAYEGAEAVFLVSNFFEHLFAGKSALQAGEAEYKQALTVVKIVDKLSSVKHFIWSTLPGNAEDQPKRTVVHHIDCKSRLDYTIRSQYPNLAARTTFFQIGYYANNLANLPLAKLFTTPASFGSYFWMSPAPSTVIIPSSGDATVNVGVFVKAILAQPEKTKGQYVCCVVEAISHDQLLEYWTQATGKPAKFLQVNPWDWNRAYGDFGEELYVNLKVFQEDPKWYLNNSPLLAKDLGIENELVDTLTALNGLREKLL